MRWLTAGESHGPCLVGILEGIPAGLPLRAEDIDRELARRKLGHGRGGRMRIEKDRAKVLSGVRHGHTTGAPIALLIENRDWENWREVMDPWVAPAGYRPVTVPRPGHADLAGAMKYGHSDLRDVIERASARETAMRVALGAVAKRLLSELGIGIASHVVRIKDVACQVDALGLPPEELNARADRSPVRCLDQKAEAEMIARIDEAAARGDSVGGAFEVVATGVPPGLGSYVHWDRRLDGRIAQALMSIPGVKGVEIGLGFQAAERWGSEVQDELLWEGGVRRPTNRAGGLEGGVTNGEPILVRAAMKPIPTLSRPLRSFDLATHEPVPAHRERADVCAVPAAAVVGEAMLALVLADALLESLPGDSLAQLREQLDKGRPLA
ncbi:chorismate synthase [Candidatus Bipolaricaulota bacterium]|nr:chorismate synthase [Candidatus Bipolaricaulota bacterium]